MKRRIQLYIQQDKIDNNLCFCLKVYIGEDGENGYFITAQATESDENNFNIYFFTYNGDVYEIRKGTVNGTLDPDAWYIFPQGDYGSPLAVSYSTEDNISANCPARNDWQTETWSRFFKTQSCTVNSEYFERLELFDDEKIVLNCSKQNIDDLKSVYSDFSQSFVVPASPHNNAILEHWYNSDVVSLQDDRLRRKARIEIDFSAFKEGKIQIDKANIKNGNIYSYTLTYFSDLINLKDKIGEAKLNVLPLSGYAYFDYDLNTVADFMEYEFDQDIVFPLISSKRLWSLGDGGVDDLRDDTTTGDGLYFTELYPAFRVKKILNEIETYFGITFTGDFIDYGNTRFMNLYLWLKNQEINIIDDIPTILNKGLKTLVPINAYQYYNNAVLYSVAEQWARLCWLQGTDGVYINLNVTSVTSSDNYYIEVFCNDELVETIYTSGTGDKFGRLRVYFLGNYDTNLDERYKFYFKSLTANTIDVEIKIAVSRVTYEELFYNNSTITLSSDKLDLDSFIPDIKIMDFLKGIFNQFNLTCYQTDENTFHITPLETWYGEGLIHDITEYCDTTTIDINRVSLPKLTRFDYEKSESFVNRIFYAQKGYEYGSVGASWIFDGAEYIINLPFEQLRFLSQPDNLVTMGYSLKSDVIPPTTTADLKEYVPKPILLYKYGLSDIDSSGHDIRMTDGTNTRKIHQAMIFGQDVIYGGGDVSLNFSTDESEFLKNGQMQYNSYSLYYQGYISNLYNKNNRLTTIKANLPLSLLTTLKLNDRLIIRGKRYIINDYQADLTSGDVSFNLLFDFRTISSYGWADDPETFPPAPVE